MPRIDWGMGVSDIFFSRQNKERMDWMYKLTMDIGLWINRIVSSPSNLHDTLAAAFLSSWRLPTAPAPKQRILIWTGSQCGALWGLVFIPSSVVTGRRGSCRRLRVSRLVSKHGMTWNIVINYRAIAGLVNWLFLCLSIVSTCLSSD